MCILPELNSKDWYRHSLTPPVLSTRCITGPDAGRRCWAPMLGPDAGRFRWSASHHPTHLWAIIPPRKTVIVILASKVRTPRFGEIKLLQGTQLGSGRDSNQVQVSLTLESWPSTTQLPLQCRQHSIAAHRYGEDSFCWTDKGKFLLNSVYMVVAFIFKTKRTVPESMIALGVLILTSDFLYNNHIFLAN